MGAKAGGVGLWAVRHPDGYEVSSRGDRRFSALYARLPDGRTIEDAWGQAKGYADGRSAKNRPALTPGFDYEGTYQGLWRQWAEANPALMDALATASGGRPLTDGFARTPNNQARALATLLAEWRPPATLELGPHPTFSIVPSRGAHDVLGMRSGGATMATAAAGEPGWLGNPYVATDARGLHSRAEATALFGYDFLRRVEQDPAFREAALGLRGKRVGYYKPDEPDIHLHPVQRWLSNQAPEGPAPVTPAIAPEGPQQLELPLTSPRLAGMIGPAAAMLGGGALTLLAIEQLNHGGDPQHYPPASR